MKGNPDVISSLASALSMERHLNLQYRQDCLCLKFMGAKKLAKKIDGFADDAHSYYSALTKRILFLEGDPSTAIAPTVELDSLTAVLQNELRLEMSSLGPYEKAIQTAMMAFDDATRNLFEHLIKWKQKHVGWLECQLDLIKKLGENDYLSEKI
jgi:bacterioferritin